MRGKSGIGKRFESRMKHMRVHACYFQFSSLAIKYSCSSNLMKEKIIVTNDPISSTDVIIISR
jgi:wobble nucleotide-excising tRNase